MAEEEYRDVSERRSSRLECWVFFFFFGVYVQGTGKHCEEQVERQTGAADAILPGMI